ncbi:MAG: UvrD-helicase domain-containing protein [Gammaproteobacteria bacterium]|nr:UvrD-helicase domain-containing protein [Gammaproteobacteria bacterium]
MTDRPRAQDAAERERAVLHEGSVLVQAPAGSGKTTLLVQRFLRVLAMVETPESVLALTFTRRAALEMRERVLRALESTRDPRCGAQLDATTLALAAAAAEALAAHGVDLLAHPSRLRIETIDAFNGWLAANLPLDTGFGQRPPVEDDARALYREAAERTLAHADDDEFGAAIERVLDRGDQRHDRLADLIAEMLPGRERWLPRLAGGLRAAVDPGAEVLAAVRERFEEDLALLVGRVLAEAADRLGAERLAAFSAVLHAVASRADAPARLAPWSADGSTARPTAADLPRWAALAAIVLNANGQVRGRITVTEGFAPKAPEKSVMLDLLREVGRDRLAVVALDAVRRLPPPVYGEQDWERVRDVGRVLVLAAAQLERVFRERGRIDFPAVSIAARRALGEPEAPTDLALRLDYRLNHVLIDEFQDTSGAQLDLLRALTAGWQEGDGRSVFCVGDPMQSIYGFRDAEVRAFLDLAEVGLGALRFTVLRLTDNFRAAPPLVDWINATFARVLPARDDRDRGAIAFRASRAARSAEGARHDGVCLAAFASPEEEAAAVAARIAERREQEPDWRIAVLVRAKRHARAIAAALRARSLAFRAVDIEPLADRPAVRDLVSLARALLHLGDRGAWLALLRAPWAGLALADLLRLARAAPTVYEALADETALAALAPAARARCRELHAVLESALRGAGDGRFSRHLERVWLALGGPACAAGDADLRDAERAFARLRELERRGLPDPAELAGEFTDLYARDADGGAVEIMTIHKAKGLEFDCVLLPALERGITARGNDFLLSLQFSRPGRDGLIMAARPAIGADADPLFEFLRREARLGANLEAERLLYVGCTRAKHDLWLSAVTGDPGESAGIDPAREDGVCGDPAAGADSVTRSAADGRPFSPRAGSLLGVLWPLVGADFGPPAPARAARTQAPEDDARRLPPLRRLAEGWSAPPIERAFASPVDPFALVARTPTPQFDWVGETARHVGTAVHAELQRLDPERDDEASLEARGPRLRRWLESRGVPAAMLDAATRRALAALRAVLADPRGRWILAGGRRDDLREQAFSGVHAGTVIHAVFDRSFIDEQGVRWVIDYKTSAHEGGGEQSFLDREVERYRPQMARYALLARGLGPEPVRLGLYFPLMRAWREWPA